jgi:hypothetical protein
MQREANRPHALAIDVSRPMMPRESRYSVPGAHGSARRRRGVDSQDATDDVLEIGEGSLDPPSTAWSAKGSSRPSGRVGDRAGREVLPPNERGPRPARGRARAADALHDRCLQGALRDALTCRRWAGSGGARARARASGPSLSSPSPWRSGRPLPCSASRTPFCARRFRTTSRSDCLPMRRTRPPTRESERAHLVVVRRTL